MTPQLANEPSWGVLAPITPQRMRDALASFDETLIFHAHSDWSVAFCMEVTDPSDDRAAERLRSMGIVPVYRLDFSEDDPIAWRWDGKAWQVSGDPHAVLTRVGLKAPYRESSQVIAQLPPAIVRVALVIEGASVDEVRALAGDAWRIEPGPVGAIVYGPANHGADPLVGRRFNDSRFALWDRAPKRVLEFEFDPESGSFWFRIMKGEECFGTFRPGQSQTWDGTPFLANVDGETQPEAIIDKFGIAPQFLIRSR